MFYDRKIRYLDYMENGDKVKSAGFVKMEVAGENCNIQISVSGLYSTDTLQREVWIGDGARETVLGQICLEAGKGSLTLKKQAADGLGKEPVAYCDLYEIRIRLGKNRELRCRWSENEQSADRPVSGRPVLSVEEGNGSAMDPVVPQSRIEREPEWDGLVTGRDDAAQGLLYVKWMERIEPVQSSEKEAADETGLEQKADIREDGLEQAGELHKNEPAAVNGKPSAKQEQMDQHVNSGTLEENKEAAENSENSATSENSENSTISENSENSATSENSKTSATSENSENSAISETIGAAVKKEMKETGENCACGEREIRREAYERPETDKGWSEPELPQEPVTQQNPSIPANLFEDKWKQLSSIYPHISPFHDERDYLSIGPGDFVILPGKYHKLVANSFLLHGYYNYEHLILTRMVKKGEERYYLGVPGNFYEREKQVAVMFGFESFECRREPAQTGDFGYFMMRVEI